MSRPSLTPSDNKVVSRCGRALRVVRCMLTREFREIREFRESSAHKVGPLPKLPKLLKLLKLPKHYQRTTANNLPLAKQPPPLPNNDNAPQHPKITLYRLIISANFDISKIMRIFARLFTPIHIIYQYNVF